MRAKWTRDEVILGLDVLFSLNPKQLHKNHPSIIKLSNLLVSLPIIPVAKREEGFRNNVGVSSMLRNFLIGQNQTLKSFNVGQIFYEVYYQYKDNLVELHNIAAAIRRCIEFTQNQTYGDPLECEDFPEGAILFHVHRNVETKYNKFFRNPILECEVCGLQPSRIYLDMGNQSVLSKHLLVSPAELDPNVILTKTDFINVCQNCHRALHLLRPWLSRLECEKILRF